MGILTRFKDIMSSNINALLDKAEDPEKMIDQCLRNLQSDLGKVKAETASVMAEEQRSKRLVDECNEEISKMQNYATKAVQAGNDGDAREFLAKKATLTSKLDELTKSYNMSSENAARMRSMHDKLSNDINELSSRKDMIKAKIAVAKTQNRINGIGSSVEKSNSSLSAFDRMESRADKMLDEANAMASLNSTPSDKISDLAKKYDSSPSSVDDELAALKASLSQPE